MVDCNYWRHKLDFWIMSEVYRLKDQYGEIIGYFSSSYHGYNLTITSPIQDRCDSQFFWERIDDRYLFCPIDQEQVQEEHGSIMTFDLEDLEFDLEELDFELFDFDNPLQSPPSSPVPDTIYFI